jgi:multidrug efflux pump subunit AcrA (membrane-fusion protein)
MEPRRQTHDHAGWTTIVTTKRELAAATCLCGILILASTMQRPVSAQGRGDDKTADTNQAWQTVAPGVVEPRSGQIKIAAPVIGRVNDVLVKINDKVVADEPLLRLDDEDAQARVASAQAQAAMREKARNEKSAGKAASRRNAEDAVADSEAALCPAKREGLRSNSGSLAILAAILRASSFVSSFAADLRPGSSSK